MSVRISPEQYYDKILESLYNKDAPLLRESGIELPNVPAIMLTKSLLCKLYTRGVRPQKISTCSEGGFTIRFDAPSGEAMHVEVYNTKEMGYITSDGKHNVEVSGINLLLDDIAKFTRSETMPKYIALEDCKDRFLYRLRSRNLGLGVFNKKTNGFVGIREKFGDRYLATEYHYDTGAPYGTACPLEELEEAPAGLEIVDLLEGTVDGVTGRMVAFDNTIVDGTKRGWYFVDTGEVDEKIRPYAISNAKLKEWLASIEPTI